WLREEKYYNIVKEKFTSEVAKHYFNTDMLVKLLDDHRAEVRDNSRKIWTVFSFLIWYDVFFGEGLKETAA
ncbi:MAG: asparagine synthetase B, partial [Oscillospiraceae bacterium]|nr:asparagine synthetase B [Oscillospiraceae bacterium]